MTFERTIVVGLEDIQAVSFECHKCQSRITILPDKLRDIPEKCHNCGEAWKSGGLPPHH
jgi:hypothetical protein